MQCIFAAIACLHEARRPAWINSTFAIVLLTIAGCKSPREKSHYSEAIGNMSEISKIDHNVYESGAGKMDEYRVIEIDMNVLDGVITQTIDGCKELQSCMDTGESTDYPSRKFSSVLIQIDRYQKMIDKVDTSLFDAEAISGIRLRKARLQLVIAYAHSALLISDTVLEPNTHKDVNEKYKNYLNDIIVILGQIKGGEE